MSDNIVTVEHLQAADFANGHFSFHLESNEMRSQPQVVHLYIRGESTKKSDDDGQFFVVFQDIHICGACSKQFVDVVDFLLHKVEHSLGKDLFKCDLCKSIVTSQQSLMEHYDIFHHISSSSLTSLSKLDDVSTTMLSNGQNNHENGKTLETMVEPDIIFQRSSNVAPPSLGFHHYHHRRQHRLPENKSRSNGRKRKSKLLVKPMLAMEESAIMAAEEEEELPDDPVLFEKVFPELEDAGEFGSFVAADAIESGGNDVDFDLDNVRVLPSAEEESSTEECLKVDEDDDIDDGRRREPFDYSFIYVAEESTKKRSRFSRTTRSWLKCLHCEYRTRKHSILTSHMTDFHKKFLAPRRTQNAFLTENGDEREHDGQKVMRMSAYERTLGRNNLRSKHSVHRLEKQDVSGIYPCSLCGKIFRRFRYLRKHQETHQTEKMFACDDCGKSFKSRTYLRVHRRIHLQKKEFSCNQCDFVSSINAAIHAHRQIHSSGSVLCDICGYAYTDRSTLGKHKRVHDLGRPYACNFPGCKWRFKTEVMCRAHIRAHTTEGKFRCSSCGYIFRHKHHLQRHELHMHSHMRSASSSSSQQQQQQSSIVPFHCAIDPTDYSLEEEEEGDEDTNHFLPMRDLDLPRVVIDQTHLDDSRELEMTFDSNDLSMLNVVEYESLLDVVECRSKDDDDNSKNILISELEVFN